MFSTGILATIASLVVGGAIAAGTVVGVVQHTVNNHGSHQANVTQQTVVYGNR